MNDRLWNRPAPPGFQGLREDLPLKIYSRHLPHWRQDGATYFVTFRLADSLPQSKLQELEAIKREWKSKQKAAATEGQSSPQSEGNVTDYQAVLHNEIRGTDWQSVLRGEIRGTDCQPVLHEGIAFKSWDDLVRSLMAKLDDWLDQGMGKCWLKYPDASKIVSDALHYFDDQQYELGCYVIMPNHVHAVLRPLQPQSVPLETILQSRKLYTSRRINALFGSSGTLWQEESYDQIIRDEEHLERDIQYIGRNSRTAGLPPEQAVRWIRPSWEALGWRFAD